MSTGQVGGPAQDPTYDDPRVAVARPIDRGTRMTRAVSRATATAGSFPMIAVAAVLVVVWLVGGFFVPGKWGSTGYQLPVSTVSSIVTFLMVFIIQSSQNRDSRALQAKVDAIADVLSELARKEGLQGHEYLLTRLVGLEDAPEREIDREALRVRQAADETAHRPLP